MRLIDVGPPDGSVAPRLRNTKAYSNGIQTYFTLSHCWGNPDEETKLKMSTTKASLAIRMKYIDFDSLPKVFRDAIRVTRFFHIRWLWIDSLCIVQVGIISEVLTNCAHIFRTQPTTGNFSLL